MPQTPTLLDRVKASQRVTNSLVNDDYSELINACKNELLRLGLSSVKVANDADTEVIHAAKLYVHWLTDYEGKGERWGQMYMAYVNSIRQFSEYMEADNV